MDLLKAVQTHQTRITHVWNIVVRDMVKMQLLLK